MRRSTPAERLQAEAQRAIEANRFDDARSMLQAAVKHDATDPRPWLMLAGIAPSARERRALLAQADRLRQAQVAGGAVVASTAASAVATPAPRRSRPASRGRALIMGGALMLLVAVLATAFLFLRALPPGVQGAAGSGPELVEPPAAIGTVGAAEEAQPTNDEGQAAESDAAATPTAQSSVAIATLSDPSEPAATGPADNAEPTAPIKQIVSGDGPLPTWTMTSQPTPTLAPTLTPTPTPEPTATPEPPPPGSPRPMGVGATEKWIDVNLTTQTLVAYEGDTQVFTTLVSSGLFQWPTVTGQYRTYMKYESQTMNGYLLGYDYYLENVPYVMYFYNDYAIHGAYWHNSFGTPMSHGCVNVSPADAGWLFNWAPVGTFVNIHY